MLPSCLCRYNTSSAQENCELATWFLELATAELARAALTALSAAALACMHGNANVDDLAQPWTTLDTVHAGCMDPTIPEVVGLRAAAARKVSSGLPSRRCCSFTSSSFSSPLSMGLSRAVLLAAMRYRTSCNALQSAAVSRLSSISWLSASQTAAEWLSSASNMMLLCSVVSTMANVPAHCATATLLLSSSTKPALHRGHAQCPCCLLLSQLPALQAPWMLQTAHLHPCC